jgi:PKD repeat protein
LIAITPGPTIDAGPGQLTCDTFGVALSGAVTGATGGTWTSNGAGIFTPGADSLNTTYIPSAADTALPNLVLTLTSTGNADCTPVEDSMVISFATVIYVTAGNNQTVCSDVNQVAILGSIISATGGVWSSSTGGTFTPSDTLMNTNYVFTPTDSINGTVLITLTTTGNGTCSPIKDSIVIDIIPAVDAGSDTLVCNSADTIQLYGSVVNLQGAQWTSSGIGIFIPNDSAMNAEYVLTPADILSGSIDFYISSSDTLGLCLNSRDTMTVTIMPPSLASAGSDATICADSAGYSLTGSISNASGSLWSSSGAGIFLPIPDSLIATYVPGSSGIDTIVLYATGSCNNAADTLLLTVSPAPTVDAGKDTSVCATNLNIPLSGLITAASGGVWTTINGTGSFTPSDTSLSPTYNGTMADTATGTIIIILTSTGNGSCETYSDTVNITYTPNLISVSAGPDTVVCNNTSGIPLNGTVAVAMGGTWTSSGSGTFSPGPDSLVSSYIPSGADTLAGAVTLTLTTTGNGGCTGASDDLLITFYAPPSISAGADTIVCFTTDTIWLTGSVANAGGAIWSTNGSGTFSPNDSALNVGYVPSVADFLNETVTLYLTTYQSCYSLVDSMRVDIVPGVIVWPADTIVCSDADTIPISGTVTGAAGGIWASSGTGIFFPDDTSMITNYIISPGDSAAGVAIITLTTTSVLMGCPPTTDSMNITISPSPIITAGSDQSVCSNQDSIQLDGSVSNAGAVWNSNGTGSFSPDSVTLNALYVLSSADTALGTVVLTLTSTGSCVTISDSLWVYISPPPSPDFTSADVCIGDTTYFTDITSGSIISWDWDFDDLNSSTIANPQNVYSSAGTFDVTLIVFAQNSCSDTIVKTVTVHPRPSSDFNWKDVCNEDTMYFTSNATVTPPDFITGYTWDFGDGMTSTATNPYNLYQNNGVYIVTLTVVSDAGCSGSWDRVVVVSPSPVAVFSANPTLVNTEEQIDFTDQSFGSSDVPDTIDISTWSWNFYFPTTVMGGTSSIPSPSMLYGDTGTYTVQLVVTNEYGCTDTAYEDVQVGLHPIVASGFNPDGTGENGNNILVVHGGPYQELKFIIYNEWGEAIFESNNQDMGWDGTFKGVPQPIGVYVYTVIATSLDGKSHHFWGDVTLLR